MKKLFYTLIIALASSYMAFGQLDTLSFDDLPATAGAIIPPYKGFTFGPGQGCAYTNFGGCGYGNNRTSNPHISYNLGAINQTEYTFAMTNGDEFDFVSLQLGLGWNCNATITITGTLGGNTVFEEDFTDMSANGPPVLVELCNTVERVTLRLTNQGANCCAGGAGPFMTIDDIVVAPAGRGCSGERLKPLSGGTSVPTMTQWGLFLFGLIVLTLGVVYIYNMSVRTSSVKE